MKVLAAVFLFQVLAAPERVAPVLEFPEPGLDDPAAYEGYRTRFFRDVHGNAVQVYINERSGRVVNVWGNAANESAAFTVRDTAGEPVSLSWASDSATIDRDGDAHWIEYKLAAPAEAFEIGHFLLGSMRIERDFQGQERHLEPFTAPPFPRPELTELIANIERLLPAERRRHLALLGAGSVPELRDRLQPALTLAGTDTTWVVRAEHPSLDARNRLALELRVDRDDANLELRDRSVMIRPRTNRSVDLLVRGTTDADALTPLDYTAIFNRDFLDYYNRARTEADRIPRAAPEARSDADQEESLRFRRLERQVRGLELVSYEEKLMASLPNYATYFGRDMMMTALMMEPIWAPAMLEHVIASVLRKLAPSGEVSHEEALGGQAIRENAAVYNELLSDYLERSEREGAAEGDTALARARAILADLQEVRENYHMVDDDFQFPILVARYLANPEVSAERKRSFLMEPAREGEQASRLALLLRNLSYVAEAAEPYLRDPQPTNLVSFPAWGDTAWFPGSWRDSRVGYGGGRFAMDVNVIWVPEALEAITRILPALEEMGFSAEDLERVAPEIRGTPLDTFLRDPGSLRQAITVWEESDRHFTVTLSPAEAREWIRAKLDWLPEEERRYWERALDDHPLGTEDLEFLALSLDAEGEPIPVLNTDPATELFLEDLEDHPDRVLRDARTLVLPYPAGLFVPELGPLVANDVYASPEVWENFERDRYHSPRVVWGREVNLVIMGLANQINAAFDEEGELKAPTRRPYIDELRDALEQVVAAVEASGLKHNELWSYRIENGRLLPVRYGASSDIQLWNLTDLAVQYQLARLPGAH